MVYAKESLERAANERDINQAMDYLFSGHLYIDSWHQLGDPSRHWDLAAEQLDQNDDTDLSGTYPRNVFVHAGAPHAFIRVFGPAEGFQAEELCRAHSCPRVELVFGFKSDADQLHTARSLLRKSHPSRICRCSLGLWTLSHDSSQPRPDPCRFVREYSL